jgi:hypothetical protein
MQILAEVLPAYQTSTKSSYHSTIVCCSADSAAAAAGTQDAAVNAATDSSSSDLDGSHTAAKQWSVLHCAV